jgi:hypothetical protein
LNGKPLKLAKNTTEVSETIPYSMTEPTFVRLKMNGTEVTYRFRVQDPDEGNRTQAKGLDVRLGWGSSSLTQDLKADSSQMGVYFRAAYGYRIQIPRVRLIADGYITALPFGSSREETARYYSVSARLSYTRPMELSPWSLQLGVGYYWNGMLVTESAFGFSKMNGLLIQPGVIHDFESGAQASGYVRLGTLVPAGISLGELSVGALYRFPAKSSGFHWLAGMDFTSLSATQAGKDLSTSIFMVTGGAGF